MQNQRHLLALAIAAVVVHGTAIAFVYARQGRIDAYAFNSLDCGEYYAIARNLVENGTFSQSKSPPLLPDTWRTPGYPLFLAASMFLGADSPTAIILVQHGLAILSVLMVFRIASQLLRTSAAMGVALISLFEPYHLFYAFWLLNTTLFTFTLLATWLAWERIRLGPLLWQFAVVGILSGFLVLVWPGAVLIPVFVLAGAICTIGKSCASSPNLHYTLAPKRLLGLSFLTVAMIIPPAAWMFRNKLVAGHFAISHQSGIVLAYFKATEVELWRQGRTEDRYVETSLNPASRDKPHRVWDEIDRRLCERLGTGPNMGCDDLRWHNLAQGNQTPRNSFQISDALAKIGSAMLLNHPVQAFACGFVRISENMAFPLGIAIAPPREAPVNRLKAAVLGIGYSALTLAALVGAFRSRKERTVTYFPIVCILALALTTTPQIDPRFRVPMIPLLAFLALLPFQRAES